MTRDRSKPPGKTRKSKAPSWVKRIHMALKQWHGPGTLSSPFADLYLYRTLARQPHITPRQATNQLLLAALNELEILYDEDAHLLRLRFLDGWPIQRLANHLNVAEGTAFANQRRAMERLADCLQEMERKASANQRATLKGRLEAQAYTNLIGVEEQIEHLLALWTQAEPPWIFAVEGIGGIGKTTLVDAVMRRIITECRFDEIGWVSARSAHMHPSGALLAAPAAPSTPEAVVIQLVKQLMPNHGALGIVTLEQMLGALKT
ncbi:MAG: hypothetical protein KDE54_19250 [Caldilineaceae bacterium]|nr:hypothetical protein [Caldilineaceae bacterium]